MKKVVILLAAIGMFATSLGETALCAEPGWSMRIIATGDFRRKIQSTPIEHRPYRPLHFYGNTVRRRHHRGTIVPVPRGVLNPRSLFR